MNRRGIGARYILAGNVSPGRLALAETVAAAAPAKSGDWASLQSGDVVVSLRGSRNAAAVVPDFAGLGAPLFASLDVAVIRPTADLHAPYLAWFLNDLRTQDGLDAQRSASAAPRLSLSALKSLCLPHPPLAQQMSIAALAAEAQRETGLLMQIQWARECLLNELLRQSAERGPHRALTRHGPNVALQIVEGSAGDSPTEKIGKHKMPNNVNGGKGGTTHVVPARQGGWDVKQGGAERATGHFDTKAEAVAAGRASSRTRESELKNHNLDGRIAQSDSHGNDPRSTKG